VLTPQSTLFVQVPVGTCQIPPLLGEDDQGREPPTWEEIQEEIKREVEIYNYYLYERTREKEYPHLKDQLDMLYHDIKAGNLENGSWIAAIDAVKENNPKPEGPEPII